LPDAIALYYAKTNMVKLRLDKLAGGTASSPWTNPATGEERSASSVERRARSFTPPAVGRTLSSMSRTEAKFELI